MVSIDFSIQNLKRFPYSPKEKYAKNKFMSFVFNPKGKWMNRMVQKLS